MLLIEVLKTAPKFRSGHGRFHELWFVLLLLIVAAGCDYWGYRPTVEFAERYGFEICEELGIEQPRRYTPKKTLETILQCNGHYLMCVKGNQKKLYEKVQAIAQQHRAIDIAVSDDRAHGRREHCIAMVYEAPKEWQEQWPRVAGLACLYRGGQRNHKRYQHCYYYIIDIKENAQTLAELIRGHWSIENQLHWVKDVVLAKEIYSWLGF